MKLPTNSQALAYFDTYVVPQNIKEHCLKVQEVAFFLARKLAAKGVAVNQELVQVASLLHDLFKAVTFEKLAPNKFHSYVPSQKEIEEHKKLRSKFKDMYENEVAYTVFKDEFPELALTLKNEGDPYLREHSFEEALIHYADYRVFQEKIVSLKERFAYLEEVYKAEEGFWQEYLKYCMDEEKEIFAHLSFTPEQLEEQLEL